MIARAAEGSVRDALSLLDQAIALCGDDIAADAVRDMLGLADRARIIDLLEAVLGGDVATALEEFGAQCAAGADPVVILSDLAALVHWVTRLKLVPGAGTDVSASEAERTRGADMAGRLSMRVLARLPGRCCSRASARRRRRPVRKPPPTWCWSACAMSPTCPRPRRSCAN